MNFRWKSLFLEHKFCKLHIWMYTWKYQIWQKEKCPKGGTSAWTIKSRRLRGRLKALDWWIRNGTGKTVWGMQDAVVFLTYFPEGRKTRVIGSNYREPWGCPLDWGIFFSNSEFRGMEQTIAVEIFTLGELAYSLNHPSFRQYLCMTKFGHFSQQAVCNIFVS